MKNILKTIFFATSFFIGLSVFAQAPQRFSYQAVIRNSSNQLLINQQVSVRISILQGSESGNVIFSEIHTPTTNNNGLITIQVGAGTNISGNINVINWANGPYFIQSETDPNGGVTYSIASLSQLLSVPYALYAGNGIPAGGISGQVLTNCDGIPTWTNGGQCPPELGSITALNCSLAINNGQLTSGSQANGINSSVPYTGGNGGDHNGQTVSSTGVLGLTATLTAGTFVNGSGSLIYTITGTPSSSGTASFALNIGGQSCTITRTVNTGGSSGSNASCGATNVHNASLTYGSMNDQDGNIYKTIVIGTQEWMAENLKASHYRNGDLIPVVTNNTNWYNLTSGASCWNYNDSLTFNCPYGKLYNGYAMVDPRNLCPAGWHVPNDNEWNQLIGFLDPSYNSTVTGDQSNAGWKMKNSDLQYWVESQPIVDNSSGFSALPGGFRAIDGYYDPIGGHGAWWSSSLSSLNSAWTRDLYFDNTNIYRYTYDLKGAMSIRCIRD